MFNYINKDHNCYQNTVAQTLFNCKSFRRFVESTLGKIVAESVIQVLYVWSTTSGGTEVVIVDYFKGLKTVAPQ